MAAASVSEGIGRTRSGVETIDGRASVSEGIGSRYALAVQAVGGRKAGVEAIGGRASVSKGIGRAQSVAEAIERGLWFTIGRKGTNCKAVCSFSLGEGRRPPAAGGGGDGQRPAV
jgi:hypothetical protein